MFICMYINNQLVRSTFNAARIGAVKPGDSDGKAASASSTGQNANCTLPPPRSTQFALVSILKNRLRNLNSARNARNIEHASRGFYVRHSLWPLFLLCKFLSLVTVNYVSRNEMEIGSINHKRRPVERGKKSVAHQCISECVHYARLKLNENSKLFATERITDRFPAVDLENI